MKLKFAKRIILFAFSFAIAIAANSQTKDDKDKDEKAFKDQYAKMKLSVKQKRDLTLEAKAKKEAELALKKDKDALVLEAYRLLQEKLKESEKVNKELEAQYPQKPGETNLLPLLEEATAPIADLPTAGTTDMEAYYKPYKDKVEVQIKQLKDLAIKYNRYNDVYQKEGQAGIEKRAIDQANKSAIVQQMGGAENLMNMSDAERKVAAEKMKKDIQNNPSLITGNSNPGMNALTQKMMSDKEYAKKFNAMSPAEKQAEMKKYMTMPTVDQNMNIEEHNKQVAKDQNEINKVRRSQEFTMLGGRTMDRLKDASERYIAGGNKITETINEMKKRIGEWASNVAKTIPIVELGEYGHDKDPSMMQALHFTERIAYYNIAKQEAMLRAQAWKQFKNDCKYAILEFNNYIGNYKWGQGSDKDLFSGTYFEPNVADAILGMYNLMLQIADNSKGISTEARGQQLSYEEAMR